MEQLSKLSEQKKWNYNPYLKTVSRSNVLDSDADSVMTSSPLGEDDKVPGIVRSKVVDNDKYVKIYTQYISQWFNLSISGQRVLSYIISIMPMNLDMVYVPIERLSAATGYSSETSLYSALNELVNKRIIARCNDRHMYFINPNFLFNGNRIVFAESIRRSPQAIKEREMIVANAKIALDSQAGQEKKEPDGGFGSLLDKIGRDFN